MKTYLIEEVIENFNVIKAIYENTDIANKWQLITAYGTCKCLADLIEIKLENLDPEIDHSEAWSSGTSKAYFIEKLTGFISNFGYVAERTLKDEPWGKAKDNADHYIYVATSACPEGREEWGPFVG